MARIAVTGLRGVPASWGGIEHHCEQLYSRLAALGHDITIYARAPYIPKNIRWYKGMKIVIMPTIDKSGFEAFVHTFLSVIDIMIAKPQIVHIYGQGPCLFSWIPRLVRPRMRVFFTCLGLDWQRKKWSKLFSAVIRLGEVFSSIFPHYLITVSKELKKYYKEHYGVNAYYIPSGARKMDKRPPHFIHRFGLKGQDYFLFVGRLVPEKRIDDVIKAYIEKKRKSKLVIVGDSAGTESYTTFLKSLPGSGESVLFAGYQYGNNLEEFYSSARAFVTASELEGLPLTLLEALSYGLPCVASDIPPHKEILRYQMDLVFPTGRVDCISNLIDRVDNMSNDDLTKCGKRAANILDKDFNWDDIALVTDRLYRESLADFKSP